MNVLTTARHREASIRSKVHWGLDPESRPSIRVRVSERGSVRYANTMQSQLEGGVGPGSSGTNEIPQVDRDWSGPLRSRGGDFGRSTGQLVGLVLAVSASMKRCDLVLGSAAYFCLMSACAPESPVDADASANGHDAIASCSSLPSGESPYIFGLHEPGGESHMAAKGKKGWIVFTEGIGHDAGATGGGNYEGFSNAGYGVIVRLNNGYGTEGTLPCESDYDAFAARAASFVASSSGSHIWVIGNEANLAAEWPTCGSERQPVTAARYVSAFAKVRNAIHAKSGHASDQVLVQGVGPWNVDVGQESVDYFAAILNGLGQGGLDGFALHTYTHGTDPGLISSDEAAGYNANRHIQFRTYRDFLGVVPDYDRELAAYITETDENDNWADGNTGWVQNVYAEIAGWNGDASHQKVRAVALYRWNSSDYEFSIESRPGVIADFEAAMNNDYRWCDTGGTSSTTSGGGGSDYCSRGVDNCCNIPELGKNCSSDQQWTDGWYCYQSMCGGGGATTAAGGGQDACQLGVDNCCNISSMNLQCSSDDDWVSGWYCYQNLCG